MNDELTITLPVAQRAFIEEAIAAGKFASASELVSTLLHDAQLRKSKDYADAQLLEALDEPGDDIPDSPEFWEGIRNEVRESLAKDNHG